MLKPQPAEATIELQLENTSTCNAKCHFCPYESLHRAGGLMPMALFKKIVDEATTIPAIFKYKIVGLGEPLLDPHFVERVKYCNKVAPHQIVETYTNGVYLTPDKFEALKAAGLDSLVISINANTQEQHEQIMGIRGKFEQTVKNAEYAKANAGDMDLEIHAVVNKDKFTAQDMVTFYRKWGHRSISDGLAAGISEANWAGLNRQQRDVRPYADNECCFRAVGGIYVQYNGIVSACCYDPTGRLPFGDLTKQTLREVYSDEKYVNFRFAHSEDRADEYAMCKECDRI